MEHSPAYTIARRRVERKIGFRIHLAVYLAVNTGLVLVNFLFTPARIWAFWPMLGWGIGLLFHGLAVSQHGAAWKQRMIENELNKLQKTE
ncbi:2TM domain-containing protein [Noviherbaspirillum denitrificans]|uniref:2TM domain-containing protein n=1 Tax=Noviherbaspirillum denitrificans TaxID=1968433 RepID=A0A254TJ53_9BURK|nr:2TM domain-containing protein [Noviherbaspirillum denitrificans]OWW22659.1 hypothetical protein AYR66_27315 [Noviherbaspirillum denitrificans]